jgi:hypothetical protein
MTKERRPRILPLPPQPFQLPTLRDGPRCIVRPGAGEVSRGVVSPRCQGQGEYSVIGAYGQYRQEPFERSSEFLIVVFDRLSLSFVSLPISFVVVMVSITFRKLTRHHVFFSHFPTNPVISPSKPSPKILTSPGSSQRPM